MDIKSIINKKREKKELTEDELRFFVFSYFKDEIMEEQAAALLTLIYTNGITQKEMAYLTNAMAETGPELEVYKISNKIVDIHPIGGIEDKVILILMSIIASQNIPIAKISGRELGLEDRLLSIPNYNTKSNFKILRTSVDNTNMGIIAEPMDIAPVEEKMYRLRNCISCNDDISLITMSIMSQKIAIGARNIVFDITCGENAYVKSFADAKKMANYLINIGNNVDKNVKCIITAMNEPVGRYFGNLLEINEVIESLKGDMATDVQELMFSLGFKILKILGIANNERSSRKIITDSIESGEAYRAFVKFLEYQNIDINDIKPNDNTQYIVPVMASGDGYIKEIDISEIRNVGVYLRAIKRRKEDNLDIGAGIKFSKKVGDCVKKGEIIAYVYTNDEVKVRKAVSDVAQAFKLSDKRIMKKSRILGTVE